MQTLPGLRNLAQATVASAFLLLAGLSSTPVALAQQVTLTLTAVQLSLAARPFLSGDDRNLHAAKRLASDGARGYDTWISPELPSIRIAPFETQADRELHADYCRSSAVLLGTALASVPHLNQAGSMIITVTGFRVDDVIKPASRMVVGSRFNVVRQGGEVTDHGERLRVRVVGRPDYQAGKTYFLLLTAAKDLPVYYGDPGSTTQLVDGRVIPSSDINAGMVRGASYARIKSQMESLAAQFPCRT
ncbi:MAG: hypothetical protein ABI128_01750 [Rhodanobacter sp.]